MQNRCLLRRTDSGQPTRKHNCCPPNIFDVGINSPITWRKASFLFITTEITFKIPVQRSQKLLFRMATSKIWVKFISFSITTVTEINKWNWWIQFFLLRYVFTSNCQHSCRWHKPLYKQYEQERIDSSEYPALISMLGSICNFIKHFIAMTSMQSQTLLADGKCCISAAIDHLVSRWYFSSNTLLYTSWFDHNSAACTFSGLSLFGSVKHQHSSFRLYILLLYAAYIYALWRQP